MKKVLFDTNSDDEIIKHMAHLESLMQSLKKQLAEFDAETTDSLQDITDKLTEMGDRLENVESFAVDREVTDDGPRSYLNVKEVDDGLTVKEDEEKAK